YAYTPVYAVPTTYVDYSYDNTLYSYDPNRYAMTPPSVISAPLPPTPLPTPAPTVALSSNEIERWDMLSNGFPRSAAERFSQVHDVEDFNVRALTGYSVSLAMLEDIPAAASVMREAVAMDPSVVVSFPMATTLRDRMKLLEQSASVAS